MDHRGAKIKIKAKPPVIFLPVGEGEHEGRGDGGGPGGGGRPALQVGAHGEAEEGDGLLEGVEGVVPVGVAGQHGRLVRDQVGAVHRLLVAYEDVRAGHALQKAKIIQLVIIFNFYGHRQ